MTRIALLALFGMPLLWTASLAAQPSGASWEDDFTGPGLDADWTFVDHYAEIYPGEPLDHVSLSMTGAAVSMSFRGGSEHNQWWVEHAQLTRPFLGAGTYETRMDTGVIANEQFGLVFQGEDPGTFLMFMMYGNGGLRGYVERFASVGGVQHRHTIRASIKPSIPIPSAGPYYLRVTLLEDAEPGERYWKFEWSLDGATWRVGAEGLLEEPGAGANIGSIREVGVFVGNHPTDLTAFDGRFDYFKYRPISVGAPAAPGNLVALPGDGLVELTWGAVAGADGYLVYRDEGNGSSLLVTTMSPSHRDFNVINGTEYTYYVSAFEGDLESSLSMVAATPQTPAPPIDPPADLPTSGMLLWLDSETALVESGAGNPATAWRDGSGWAHDATADAEVAPTVVPSAINGRPALHFDGVDDHLRLPSGFEDFRNGLTLFVVAQPSSLQPGFKLMAFGNGAGNDMIVLGRNGSSAGLQYFTNNVDGQVGWFNTSDALAAGEASLISVRQAGGGESAAVSASVSNNGLEVGSGEVFVPAVTARAENLIGKSFWNEGRFEGALAEILVYDRELSDAEVAIVRAYLDEKYRLGIDPTDPPPDPELTVLDPPTNLSAESGDSHVTLSWDAVAGVLGYRIWRSEDGGNTFTALLEISDMSFDDAGLVNLQPYTYVVTAYDATSESAESLPVTVTPQATVTPPEIPVDGLVLRLDAGQAAADFGDGAPITTWQDLSGAGHDAGASLAAAPIVAANAINGQPALYFDGQDDHFSLPAGLEDFSGGLTLYVVARPTTLQAGFKLVALGNATAEDMIVLGRAGGTAGLQYFTSNAAGNVGWFNTNSALEEGEVGVFAVDQGGGYPGDSTTATVEHNLEVVGSGTVFVPHVISRTSSFIGRSFWNEGRFEGDLAEVILYDRSLDDAERDAIEAYLDAKYGLGLLQIVPPDPDPPSPPDAPAQLNAIAGDAEVTLSWTAVAGVDGYRLWSADGDSDFTVIYEGSATTFNDAPLDNGNTYYYVVTAYDTGGESFPSTQADATPEAIIPSDPPLVSIPVDGLRLLLDAEIAAEDYGFGAEVTSWRDQSGDGQDAWSDPGTAPVVVSDGIGGRPALRFDGVNDHFSLPPGFEDLSNGVSLFVVMRPTVLHSGFKILALGNGPGKDMVVLGRAGSADGLQYFTNNEAGQVTWFNSDPVLNPGEAGLFAIEHEGSTARVVHNGAVITESSVDPARVTSRSVNYIGKSYWSEGYLEGDLAEVVLYDRLLTDSERAAVEAYLDSKYSLGMGTQP